MDLMNQTARSNELLRLAAKELSDNSDPFAGAFLQRHNVTLNEVGDLADQLALGAHLLLAVNAWRAKGRSPRRVIANELLADAIVDLVG